MEAVFLSTGWALPTRRRSGTAVFLRDGGVLFDCGGDVASKLVRAGIPLGAVHRIYLSHGHPDHVNGLPGYIHACKFIDERPPLEIRGPRTAVGRARRVLENFEIETEFAVESREIPPGEGTDGTVRYVEADHPTASLSYRLGDFVFTGDTSLTEDLVRLAKGADLLVAEATATEAEGAERHGHMSPEEAGELADKAGVRRLVMIHKHPSMRDEEVIERSRRPEASTPVDLDRIPL